MKIAICDDLPGERLYLLPILQEYFKNNDEDVACLEYASGEALLAEFVPGLFSLAFLDIYMDGMTGVETARQLKAIDPNCDLIFTTTSREHGAEAFDLEVFYYLVKPLDKAKLFTVMNKWYNLFCKTRTITLKCGRLSHLILISDIIYIEVLGRNSSVHTTSEILESQTALAAIEAMLPAAEFCRSIRYCLVSLQHVKKVNEEHLLLDNGVQLPLSRRERENIRARLAAWRLQQLRKR